MQWNAWGKRALISALGFAILAGGIPAAASANGTNGANGTSVKSVEFVGMPAPATPQQMAQLYTTASVKVTYSNGSVRSFPLVYKKLFKSTDKVGGTIAGVAVDAKGNPIMDTTNPSQPVPYVSEDPDANSLFAVPGMKATGKGGNALSLVTHYEYINRAYGIVPASMSLTTVDQNKKTGELTPVDLKKIDFSSVDGLWIPCNGSLTPWNTHLGSEEYEPDARDFEADPTKTYTGPFVQNYYNDTSKKGNPYAYGFLTEVTVNKDNSASVEKHYSMGRFSHELGKVAPDSRTVLFGDDGGNTMLFLYVADKAKDLSAGTLYAAKWIQKSAANGGSADLQWIKLGHASDKEIRAYIDQDIQFGDIFEASGQAASGFTAVKTYPSGKVEYLKVKPGMEKAAAFLESRRYGAILGATSEFNKMEGVAFDTKTNKAYVAMSYVEKAMEKDAKGTDPADDIRVDKISAGVTYELTLAGKQKDKSGAAIDSAYVPMSMQGLVAGEDLKTPDALGNKANPDKVANPDNLSFSQELRTLFIGEDSGMHVNNFVWAYNVDTKKLSRILSTPAGAEATGLAAVDDLNGFNYVMSNIQHPGDEMIVAENLKAEVEKYIDQYFDNKSSGVVGYLSGLPTKAQLHSATAQPQPAKEDAGALVPLREKAEAAHASLEVSKNGREVTVFHGTHKLVVRVGSKTAVLDGENVALPAAPRLTHGRVWMPGGVLGNFLSL
ncbi:alkaline phosphatase PhoX [Cohnella caldifontis]|uniref:alkaline phosphatase PhoX n=1 Tax=Cohnella caldifontis TaxID=3027471 RepID=UPI0023EE1BC4|nr:alkaline phosphatase PhoX [Cohnella sp. YIM B05605]